MTPTDPELRNQLAEEWADRLAEEIAPPEVLAAHADNGDPTQRWSNALAHIRRGPRVWREDDLEPPGDVSALLSRPATPDGEPILWRRRQHGWQANGDVIPWPILAGSGPLVEVVREDAFWRQPTWRAILAGAEERRREPGGRPLGRDELRAELDELERWATARELATTLGDKTASPSGAEESLARRLSRLGSSGYIKTPPEGGGQR